MQALIIYLRLTNLPRSLKIFLCTLSIVQIIVFIFNPISFGYIASFVTEQNYKLALMWASINFMLQILNNLATLIKNQQLSNCYLFVLQNLKNNNSLNDNEKQYFASFIYSLNSITLLILRILAILLVALIYSINLFVFVLISFLLTALFLFLLNKFVFSKNKNSARLIATLTIVLNILWAVFTYVILFWSIIIIDKQIISLTVFLLVNAFVSNHISKVNFNLELIFDLKKLKTIINKIKI